MSGSAELETFAAGVETVVDVAQVQRQLNDLWQLASEGKNASVHHSITRACLFNLVVYCESDVARERAIHTISEITSRNPCRAIVLLAQPKVKKTELSASISAHCHLSGSGGKQVCCEQISINARGEGVNHLAGALLPLLESDLPTNVWWQENFLIREDLYRKVSAIADRIFFDTSEWCDAKKYLPQLLNGIRKNRHSRFVDLSWTRLAFWRKLTAELFDSSECRIELEQVKKVEIVYGQGPGAKLRGLFFASWLATQLAWDLEKMPRIISLIPSTEETTKSNQAETGSAGLLRVTIHTQNGKFIVLKNYGEQTASAIGHLAQRCELPRKQAFWPTDVASLLAQELDQSSPKIIYERTLAMASRFASES